MATSLRRLALLLALPVLLLGCAEQKEPEIFTAAEQELVEVKHPSQQAAATSLQQQQTPGGAPRAGVAEAKRIKQAFLRFRVEDYAAAEQAAERRVEAAGGYVSRAEERRSPQRIETSMTIRVPAAQFDVLLDTLSDLAAEIDRRRVEAEDVTEQFVDLQARLRTRRALEERYVSLLGEANRVEDMLLVEEQLGDVREEIERAEGRLEYLRDRVARSTIDLLFYERLERPARASGFLSSAAGAFGNGWRIVVGTALALITLWPVFLAAGLGFLAYRSYRRSAAEGRQPSPSAPPATD